MLQTIFSKIYENIHIIYYYFFNQCISICFQSISLIKFEINSKFQYTYDILMILEESSDVSIFRIITNSFSTLLQLGLPHNRKKQRIAISIDLSQYWRSAGDIMTRNFPSGAENAGCTITSNKLVDFIVLIDFFRLFIHDRDRVFVIQ